MLKVSYSGKVTVHGLDLDFTSVSKGRIHFNVKDTSKWYYEKGYNKSYSRVISKKKTISFDGVTLDLNDINGMDKI